MAGNVPYDVEQTVKEVMKVRGYLTEDAANKMIAEMKNQDRWTVNPFSAVMPVLGTTSPQLTSLEFAQLSLN